MKQLSSQRLQSTGQPPIKETKEQSPGCSDARQQNKRDNIMSHCTLKTIEEEDISQQRSLSQSDDPGEINEEADIDDEVESQSARVRAGHENSED